MRSIFNRIFLSWTWFDQIIIGTVKAFSRNTYNKHENNLYMVYLRSNYVFQMNIFVTMRKLCCSFQHQQEIKSIKIRALDKHLMKNFINVFHHGYLQMESFILKIDKLNIMVVGLWFRFTVILGQCMVEKVWIVY